MTTLPPLPQPGLSLFPGYIAHKPETFFMKLSSAWSSKDHYEISFASAAGQAGTPFLRIDEDKRNHLSFKTLQGQEVMRIVRQKHNFSGRGTEYHGMRGDGKEVWYLKLHRGLTGTDYNLSIFPNTPQAKDLPVQNKVLGQDKGILYNGSPVTTISQPSKYGHLRREDIIQVAPGMDILLSLGVAWIRADKQAQDEKTAISVAT